MAKIVDYSKRPLSGPEIKGAGYVGAIRYLVNSPNRGLPNKRLTPEEARSILDAGLGLASNWQRGKEVDADWRRGFPGGVEDAREGWSWHKHCGGPDDRPIFFSVDKDLGLAELDSLVGPYLEGAASVIGKDNVGVYGGQRTMLFAKSLGYKWLWQTRSWSRYDANGNWNGNLPVQWVEGVQLRQVNQDAFSIGDVGIDENDVMVEDWGQWNLKMEGSKVPTLLEKVLKQREEWRGGDPVWMADLFRLWGIPVWELLAGDPVWNGTGLRRNWWEHGRGDYSPGAPFGPMIHHTAGGGINDWKIVAIGRSDLPGPLSCGTIEKDGTVRILAVGICNHAGDGRGSVFEPKFGRWANSTSMGFECVSRGTPPWDWTEQQLKSMRLVSAAVCWFLKRDSSWVPGHKEYNLVDGKIDPAGIDMNVFRNDVQWYINNPPITQGPGAIEQCWERNKWLGKRLHDEAEIVNPDGVGRRAHFENGAIYWSPDTPATPIKPEMMEFWGKLGWETSWLGYPVEAQIDADGGIRQWFCNGGLFKKDGDTLFFPVGGGIKDTWLVSGGVTGPLGWPQSRESERDKKVFQDYEHGRVVWRMDQGPVVTLDRADRDELL